jgi:hypothetical protein
VYLCSTHGFFLYDEAFEKKHEIRGFHGDDVDAGLLGTNALKMAGLYSSETLVSTYMFIQRCWLEDQRRRTMQLL